MNTASTAQQLHAVILESAEHLFRSFGYGKTTMAEIAEGCHMSAGNIYRYFAGKEEIGAAVAERCMAEHVDAARQVARSSEPSAARKLEEMIVRVALLKHDLMAADSRMNDLVATIAQKRHDLLDKHIAALAGLTGVVLEQGIASGEFRAMDVPPTGEAIVLACVGVWYPLLTSRFTPEELERRGRALARLLIDGLRG